MARPSKPQSTSPNKILVIFLVFFILSNLGFAIWVYTLVKDRDKWDVAARAKTEDLKSVNQTLEWTKYKNDEMSAAIGDPEFGKRPEVLKAWKENRESFLKQPQQKFKGEEGEKEFSDLIKNVLEARLGEFNDGYKNKFADLVEQQKKELGKVQKDYALEVAKNTAKQEEFLALQKKYNADRDAILKEIKGGNDKIYEARMKNSEQMTAALRQNEVLAKDIADKQAEFNNELTKKNALITSLEGQAKRGETIAKSANKSGGESRALVLDISAGKPLWDTPRGKIIRVDVAAKKVTIDKGSKDGVKPGLTFAVFAAGDNGRGEGEAKATIEVVRVIDSGTSLCKISTSYDPVREPSTALKDGDLIFNVLWGSHVAVVGVVDVQGSGANKTAAAQVEDLNDFMRKLERMGIVVDAYTDLREGKLVGELTPKTNFVIRGNPVLKGAEAADEGRAKGINDAMATVREQAADRGLFIISPANFAILSGQRRFAEASAK